MTEPTNPVPDTQPARPDERPILGPPTDTPHPCDEAPHGLDRPAPGDER
jgi:hypothetical protein